ncbi:MAG: two-component regulator propeller domain-containing protein, partial [Bacteroidota bacterium]
MQRISALLFCYCLLTCSSWGQQYHFRQYSLEEGLPRSGVYAMHEDRGGYLWVATEGGGVCAFDGITFTTYTTGDGLADNTVRCIFEDRDGHLWFGTQGKGISRFDGQSFTTYDARSGLSNGVVRTITQDAEGHLLIGTLGDGVFRLHPDSEPGPGAVRPWLSTENGLSHDKVRASCTDPQGQVWLGTDRGITRWHDGKLTYVAKAQGLPDDRVLDLFADREGRVWVGTGKGAVCVRPDTVLVYRTRDGLVHPRVRAISQDAEGNLWFGTKQGTSRFDGQAFTSFTEDQGLGNNRIRDILHDSFGDLWFATYYGGINRLRKEPFVHFDKNDGLAGNQVPAVQVGSEGRIWVGSFDGLSVIDPTAGMDSTVIRNVGELGGREVYTIVRDTGMAAWIGTDDGLRFWNGREYDPLITALTRELGAVHPIHPASPDSVWVGTPLGLQQLVRDSGDTFAIREPAGLESARVSSFATDAAGRLWVGYANGNIEVRS